MITKEEAVSCDVFHTIACVVEGGIDADGYPCVWTRTGKTITNKYVPERFVLPLGVGKHVPDRFVLPFEVGKHVRLKVTELNAHLWHSEDHCPRRGIVWRGEGFVISPPRSLTKIDALVEDAFHPASCVGAHYDENGDVDAIGVNKNGVSIAWYRNGVTETSAEDPDFFALTLKKSRGRGRITCVVTPKNASSWHAASKCLYFAHRRQEEGVS